MQISKYIYVAVKLGFYVSFSISTIILELQNVLFHDDFSWDLYVIKIIRKCERSASPLSKF